MKYNASSAIQTFTIALLALGLAACQITPPISVGSRQSLAGQGVVLAVTNTSDQPLHEVTVRVTSPGGEVKTWSTPTLSAHESVNVGWLKLDGWPIPEGSEVHVSCKDYMADAGPFKASP
jgi:hypothetical protein